MDLNTLKDTVVAPKLKDVFGADIAERILSVAITFCMTAKTEQEKMQKLIEGVCSNPRATAMWGAARTQQQKAEWLAKAR